MKKASDQSEKSVRQPVSRKIRDITRHPDFFPALSGILCLCFTLFLAGPLFLYLSNREELWFDIYNMLPVILPVFLISMVLLGGLTVFLYRLHPLAGRVFVTLVFIMALAFYIQGNFIGCDYGELNGDTVHWNEFPRYAKESLILWLGIPLGAAVTVKLAGFKNVSRIAALAGLIIIGMQLAALSPKLITGGMKPQDTRVITTDASNTYSSGKNIVFLLFDALDAELTNEALEADPSLREELKDFIYYPDTAGMYQNTKCSAPYILTGELYKNEEPFPDYVEKAYRDTDLYNQLDERNFAYGLYAESTFVSKDMEGRVENLRSNRKVPSSSAAFCKMLYRFVFFRYAPHQLKQFFWFYSGDFNTLISLKEDVDYELFPLEEQLRLYDILVNGEFQIDNTRNVFKYFHTRGVHKPYEFDAEMQPLSGDGSGSIDEAAKGCFKFLKDYIARLKAEGLYDNTALIVLSDHGYTLYHQNPTLMFKNFNADHPFTISDSPVSFEDLVPAIEKLAGDGGSGKTTADIFGNAPSDRIRPYYFYEWNTESGDYLPPIKVFEVRGRADDIDSMVETETVYKAHGETAVGTYTYAGDDTIIFDDSDKCNSIIKVGVSSYLDYENGVVKRWSNAGLSQFQINLPGGFSDAIRCTINADTWENSTQTVVISVNNQELDRISFSGGTFSFTIPADMARDGILGIKLAYPDKEMEFGERGITLHFSEMILETV
ncbi:MAG: sulfatase-like hydrolase/transferase [Lachnospiraceae bacterium]|nr:sulfatase-like hydrolase/transferase [Lachnospiraceae bacterium]